MILETYNKLKIRRTFYWIKFKYNLFLLIIKYGQSSTQNQQENR